MRASVSVADRAAVLARFGGTQQHTARVIDPDPLVTTEGTEALGDAMAFEHQLTHYLRRHAALQVQRAAVLHHIASGLARPLVMEACRVAGLLHVHPEV